MSPQHVCASPLVYACVCHCEPAAHLVLVHGLLRGTDHVNSLASQRLIITIREVQPIGAIGANVLALLHQASSSSAVFNRLAAEQSD